MPVSAYNVQVRNTVGSLNQSEVWCCRRGQDKKQESERREKKILIKRLKEVKSEGVRWCEALRGEELLTEGHFW